MLTSSPKLEPRALAGAQRPRVHYVPPRAGSLVDECLDLWTIAGRVLDPWQELSLDGILSVNSFGMWVCSEWGELVARQNGKGDIITAYCLAMLFLWPKPDGTPRTIVYTAHQFKTAQEMFRRMRLIIESSSVLMAELRGGARGIRMSHGEQGFELANGNRLLYLARSRHSGVGFTIDALIVDEAQETPIAAMDALLPTMSSVENTQVLFFGTAPTEENDAEHWEGVRDRGRSLSAPRTGWMEFTPEGSDDPEAAAKISVYSDEAAEQANPGLGFRPGLQRAQIEDERGTPERKGQLSPDSYRIQRLSIWPNRDDEAVEALSDFDVKLWRDHAQPSLTLGETVVLSVACGRGGGHATIAAASRTITGKIFVEHLRTDGGTAWVAAALKAYKAEHGDALIVLDAKNASSILVDLERERIKYLSMNLDEIAAAHAQMIYGSNAGDIVGRGQEEVALSFEFATTRTIGRSGSTWEASDPKKPVSHAQAVTWAAWGLRKFEALPPREDAVVRSYA